MQCQEISTSPHPCTNVPTCLQPKHHTHPHTNRTPSIQLICRRDSPEESRNMSWERWHALKGPLRLGQRVWDNVLKELLK